MTNNLRRLAVLFALCAVSAWSADVFPLTDSENLMGKKVSMPQAASGHVTVIIIGFTHASNSQVKDWGVRLQPDIPIYSIAVLEDAPRLVRGMAMAGIKSSVPQSQRDHFLIVIQGEKALKEALGFDRPDDAYVALIDALGTIRWRGHGPVTEDLLRQLREQAAHLVNLARWPRISISRH